MAMAKMTRMQQKIYDYIAQALREQGYPPSVREIGEAVGLKSPSTVHFHLKHMEELDGYISKYAIGWNLSRISRTARAIMQLAMYECLYVHDVPVSAAINEAVELTRKYEDEDVVAFVNGILGAFAREVAAQ